MKSNYISFKQAKLLSKKGFTRENGWACRTGWVNYLTPFTGQTGHPETDSGYSFDDLGNPHLIECPTYYEVIEWLLQDFNIWLYEFRHNENEFYWSIDANIIESEFTSDDSFNSPQEAYSAAFDYILKHVI